MVSVTIVGAGVVGLSIAKEISDLFDEVYVLEKEHRLGEHASGRSSQVNHAGIYYPSWSLKARLCVEGNNLLREFCPKYKIPYLDVGKLVVAVNEQEEQNLEELLKKGENNGVPNLKIISKEDVKKIEPNVNCLGALYVPTSGIFDTLTYLKTLSILARDKGALVMKRTEVTEVNSIKDGFKIYISTNGGPEEFFHTDFLINAAGIFSDKIAQMVNLDNNYKIIPIRGEITRFFKSKKRPELDVSMNIYPTPKEYTIKNGTKTFWTGIHLTPVLEEFKLGREITITPFLVEPKHKEDYQTSAKPKDFLNGVNSFFPHVKQRHLQYPQAGISAKLVDHKDFLIEFDCAFPQCLHLLGFDSPGLTASPATGLYVRKLLQENI